MDRGERSGGTLRRHMELPQVPVLVSRAKAVARVLDFSSSCSDEVGNLLRLLTLGVGVVRVGEIGTGCGVGAAWIASGLRASARLHTVELDADRANAATRVFEGSSQVRVIHGDWHGLLRLGPFDLLFADVGSAKAIEPQILVDALTMGGTVLLDDLTPEELWTAEQRREWSRGDPVRTFWLGHGAVVAAELRVSATSSVILGVRSN